MSNRQTKIIDSFIGSSAATITAGTETQSQKPRKKAKNVYITNSNLVFCDLRVKTLVNEGIVTRSDYINWLIEQDRKQNTVLDSIASTVHNLES